MFLQGSHRSKLGGISDFHSKLRQYSCRALKNHLQMLSCFVFTHFLFWIEYLLCLPHKIWYLFSKLDIEVLLYCFSLCTTCSASQRKQFLVAAPRGRTVWKFVASIHNKKSEVPKNIWSICSGLAILTAFISLGAIALHFMKPISHLASALLHTGQENHPQTTNPQFHQTSTRVCSTTSCGCQDCGSYPKPLLFFAQSWPSV